MICVKFKSKAVSADGKSAKGSTQAGSYEGDEAKP